MQWRSEGDGGKPTEKGGKSTEKGGKLKMYARRVTEKSPAIIMITGVLTNKYEALTNEFRTSS